MAGKLAAGAQAWPEREKRIERTGKGFERSGSREKGVWKSLGSDPRTEVPVNRSPVVAKSKDLAWSWELVLEPYRKEQIIPQKASLKFNCLILLGRRRGRKRQIIRERRWGEMGVGILLGQPYIRWFWSTTVSMDGQSFVTTQQPLVVIVPRVSLSAGHLCSVSFTWWKVEMAIKLFELWHPTLWKCGGLTPGTR